MGAFNVDRAEKQFCATVGFCINRTPVGYAIQVGCQQPTCMVAVVGKLYEGRPLSGLEREDSGSAPAFPVLSRSGHSWLGLARGTRYAPIVIPLYSPICSSVEIGLDDVKTGG
jgi:hypothetical protein